MSKVRLALLWSLSERYLLIVLGLATSMLLARLLTPREIGLYSVSLAVIGIAQVMREFGIGSFLIQEKNLDKSHVRTAFGVSLIIGGALFVLVAGGAPFAARFYGEPGMKETLWIASLNFLVLPFCSISNALLRRDLLFARILYVTMAATIIGSVVSLYLAYLGFGANSLAIGSVCTNAATGIGTWLARDDRSVVSPSLERWREVMKFGTQSSAASVVANLSIDMSDLVIGKVMGFAPVAIMSRAQGLMNLFHRDVMGAVRNVAYPAFALAHRQGEPLESRFAQSTSIVCLIGWPFYGFVALFALEIIRLMFGTQWDAAASLVPILCAGGAFAACASLTNSLMMAAGRIDLVTRGELIFQPLRAASIALSIMLSRSLEVCAIVIALGYLVYIPFIFRLKGRCIANEWPAFRAGMVASGKVTIIALAPAFLIASHAGFGRAEPVGLVWLLSAAAATVLMWALGVYVVRHSVIEDPAVGRLLRSAPRFK